MHTPHHAKEYPCDSIINRYLPNVSPEERDKAREDLTNFVQALLTIATRRALEERAGTGQTAPIPGPTVV